MNKIPKISIIVPVYKVEKYLPKCIESILDQTYTDFELLLIDDGSPDFSGKICDEYSLHDSRIRVFHKENGGVSSARNFGIDNAKGEWLTFFDGDDSVAPDTLKICSKYFNSYDIVRFSIVFDYGESTSTMSICEQNDLDQYRLKVISRDAILGVCVGLYKKELFITNSIRFDEALISGEDWLVQFELLTAANTIKIINRPLYIYNKLNVESATSVFRIESHMSALLALRRIEMIASKYMRKNYFQLAVKIAESQLVYDFLASKIVRRKLSKHNLMTAYRRLTNLRIKDIRDLRIPLKQKLLLSLYISPIGRIIFFK